MAKRLYIQLYCANTGESLTLPINPESIEIPNQQEINTYNILNWGEVGVRSNRKLKRVTLSKFLPENKSVFSLLASLVKSLDYRPYSQEEAVKMLNSWVDEDKIIRLIISGHINQEFQVEAFNQVIYESTGEKIDYSIELVEYRNPTATPSPQPPKSKLQKLKERIIDKYIPSQYVGKEAQTIYKLAKLTYGGKWQELAQKNNITDANLNIAGQVIEMLPIE